MPGATPAPITIDYTGSGLDPKAAAGGNAWIKGGDKGAAVQQTTTAQRQSTAANVSEFNSKIAPAMAPSVVQNSSSPTGVQIQVAKGDTLSGLAAKYGVSVDEFLSANKGSPALPDPSNPSLIIAGQKLNVPQAPKAESGKGGGEAPAAGGAPTAPKDNGDGTSTDASGNKIYTGGNTRVLTGNQDIDKQIEQIKGETKTQIDQITSTMDKLVSMNDSSTSGLIQAIMGNYNALKSKLDDQLSRQIGGLNQSNIRGGRARYAPVLAAGIISNAEIQEAMKLDDAFQKMMLSVSKAQQAQTNGDTKIFNTKFAEIKSLQKDMASSVEKLYTLSSNTLKAQNKQIQEENKARRDAYKDTMDRSKRSAPGLAKEISGMASEKDQFAFLQKYSKNTGIPMDVLWGDVSSELSKSDKNDTIHNAMELRSMVYNFLDGKKDPATGAVSQADYDTAKKAWVAGGGKIPDFEKEYSKTFEVK